MDVKIRITPQARAEAKAHPNGWVYVIDGGFDPNGAIPPDAIVGAWKVDSAGNIIKSFIPNPGHKQRATGRLAPRGSQH